MLYGCEERERERGTERRGERVKWGRGREDEIYRIFEIPVHSACRTRRLHFCARKPPLSFFASPRSLLIFVLPVLFPVSGATPLPHGIFPSFSSFLDRLRCIRTRKHPRISVDHDDAPSIYTEASFDLFVR